MLADMVDDLFELTVEFVGLGDEAMVGTGQGHRGLGPAGDDDQVVRGEAHDNGLDAVLPLNDVGGEDTWRGGAAQLTS